MTQRQYFVTSRLRQRLAPLPILALRRGQWGIKTSCCQRLDVTVAEDKSRVRNKSAVAVLGLLSRVCVALFVQDLARPQPQRDKTLPVWIRRQQRQPRALLDRLLKPCLPP